MVKLVNSHWLKKISDYLYYSLNVIYNTLMANSMGDDSSFISEESDNNIFNRSDVAVANRDVEIIDVN